jgi:hypothetical protein
MDQELWRKVEELFHAALDCAPEARQAFLDGLHPSTTFPSLTNRVRIGPERASRRRRGFS